MISDYDIDAFAEDLFNRYGVLAGEQALKRAKALAKAGDERNSVIWYRIRERVVEMRADGGAPEAAKAG